MCIETSPEKFGNLAERRNAGSRRGGPTIRSRILALLAETGQPLRVDTVAALLSLHGEPMITPAQVNAVVSRDQIRWPKKGEQVTLAACLRPAGMQHGGFVVRSDWPLNQRLIGVWTPLVRHLQALRLQLRTVRSMDRHLADAKLIWRLTANVHQELGSPSLRPPRNLADVAAEQRAAYVDQVIKELEAFLATLEPLDQSDRMAAEHVLLEYIRDEATPLGSAPPRTTKAGTCDSKQ